MDIVGLECFFFITILLNCVIFEGLGPEFVTWGVMCMASEGEDNATLDDLV